MIKNNIYFSRLFKTSHYLKKKKNPSSQSSQFSFSAVHATATYTSSRINGTRFSFSAAHLLVVAHQQNSCLHLHLAPAATEASSDFFILFCCMLFFDPWFDEIWYIYIFKIVRNILEFIQYFYSRLYETC